MKNAIIKIKGKDISIAQLIISLAKSKHKYLILDKNAKIKFIELNKGMKIIGIVADNYKLLKFEHELKLKGYERNNFIGSQQNNKDYSIIDFINKTSTIKISVKEDEFNMRQKEIHAICVKIETHFKRSN